MEAYNRYLLHLDIFLGLYCIYALKITDISLSVSPNLLHMVFQYSEEPDKSGHKELNNSHIPEGLPILNVLLWDLFMIHNLVTTLINSSYKSVGVA